MEGFGIWVDFSGFVGFGIGLGVEVSEMSVGLMGSGFYWISDFDWILVLGFWVIIG